MPHFILDILFSKMYNMKFHFERKDSILNDIAYIFFIYYIVLCFCDSPRKSEETRQKYC